VIIDHGLHILVIELRAVQLFEFLHRLLMFGVECRRRRRAAAGSLAQHVARLHVVGDHPLGELLHRAVHPALLRELTQLDLGLAARGRELDEVSIASGGRGRAAALSSGGGAAGLTGCARAATTLARAAAALRRARSPALSGGAGCRATLRASGA